MRQRRNGARFTLEPRDRVGPSADVGRQHLDRDIAIEFGVARAIDLAHAPCADRPDDFIAAEARAGGQ